MNPTIFCFHNNSIHSSFSDVCNLSINHFRFCSCWLREVPQPEQYFGDDRSPPAPDPHHPHQQLTLRTLRVPWPSAALPIPHPLHSVAHLRERHRKKDPHTHRHTAIVLIIMITTLSTHTSAPPLTGQGGGTHHSF